jgi:DNA-binding response OmpR family regulator
MDRILVVSSDNQRLADFAAVLSSSGFEVAWEESGENALQQAKQIRPALVILDEHLEDMTAWQAIKRLLAIDAGINTGVVTKLDPEKFHAMSEGLGVMACIPFRPTKLAAVDVINTLNRIRRLNPSTSFR